MNFVSNAAPVSKIDSVVFEKNDFWCLIIKNKKEKSIKHYIQGHIMKVHDLSLLTKFIWRRLVQK